MNINSTGSIKASAKAELKKVLDTLTHLVQDAETDVKNVEAVAEKEVSAIEADVKALNPLSVAARAENVKP